MSEELQSILIEYIPLFYEKLEVFEKMFSIVFWLVALLVICRWLFKVINFSII